MIITLKNETETTEIGARVASCLKGGEVIYLKGELGTGKTTLVRGALNELGHTGNVKSPTYTICLLYTSPSPRDGLLSRMPSSA